MFTCLGAITSNNNNNNNIDKDDDDDDKGYLKIDEGPCRKYQDINHHVEKQFHQYFVGKKRLNIPNF